MIYNYLRIKTKWHKSSIMIGTMYYINHLTTRNMYSALNGSLFDALFENEIYSARRLFEIEEDDNKYVLHLELPGFKQEHLDVTIQNDSLTVKAEKDKYYFVKTIVIPKGVDKDKVEAKLEDGILTLTLPKQEEAKPRKLSIKT